jgi:hypothetical protein
MDGGEIPKSMGASVVCATDTCVAIGCRSEDDGETEFTLATLAELDRKDEPAFEGMLKTPKHHVVIRTVLGQQVLTIPFNQELTKIKVWINDPNEPDTVVVGVG